MPDRPGLVAVVHSRPAGVMRELDKRGIRPIACPVLAIKSVNADIDPRDFDAALLTSANAVESATNLKLPVYCVGPQTGKAALRAGLTVLAEGDGTAQSLIPMSGIKGKRLIHLSGKHIAPGTQGAVRALEALSVCVYEALPSPALPLALMEALEDKELAAVMMFSARAAEAFTQKLKQGTNLDLWRGVRGVALSRRIACAMEGLPYAEIKVAARPDRNAILEALVS